MITITNKRNRDGEFYGCLLGSDGRFYTEADLYDADKNPLFEFEIVEQPLDAVPAIKAEAERVEAENALNELRAARDKRLAATDWWAYQDTPEMTAEQTAYRQALRDITTRYTSLSDVVWPVKP